MVVPPTARHQIAVDATVLLAGEVETAADTIAPHVCRTPTITLPWLNNSQREIWAKLECWQISGSVKARSAFNVLAAFDRGQQVVTACARNHALAVATAASALGLSCVVFVPIGTPAVYARRITELGAHIEVAGGDIGESFDQAAAYSQRHGVPLVAPFADPRGAAGLGTCVSEAFQDCGPFDTVVLPLGSGTLLAGAGAWLAAAQPRTNLVAVHPATFERPFGQEMLTTCLSQPCGPTLADSLAGQLPAANQLAPVLDQLRVSVHQAEETTTALGIFALLHRQHLLVEGAGAAAVGALLTDTLGAARGRTLIILSGGNTSSSDLARAFTVDVHDPHVRRHLGLRHRAPVLNQQPVRSTAKADIKHIDDAHRTAGTPRDALPAPTIARVDPPGVPIPEITGAVRLLAAHRRYVSRMGLRPSPGAHRIVDVMMALAGEMRDHLVQCGNGATDPQADACYEDDLRLLHQLVGFVRQSMEWASPAHDQSQRINFFDPNGQMPDIANYARYGNADLRGLESDLARMLGFDRHDVELLATSSGMAAYQLAEAFLLRYVLQPGDAVVCPPYIYFEAREQLTSLPFLQHVQAPSFEPRDLVHAAESRDARVIFVDPVANVAGLPTVDLRELAKLITDRPGWSERWLVIDGTMISGGVAVFDIFPIGSGPQVLYYESASKYAQLGLDLQMAGLCVAAKAFAPPLRTMRRNTGTVLYPEAVARFPRAGRTEFLSRMRRISSNAHQFATRMRQSPSVHRNLSVGSVDSWSANGWLHGGGVVTLRFNEPGLNNRDVLEAFIDNLMHAARHRHLPLVRGVSFGLSTTRVSAASSTAEFHDPFLRFAVGVEPPERINVLADLVIEVVAQHTSRFKNSALHLSAAVCASDGLDLDDPADVLTSGRTVIVPDPSGRRNA